MKKFKNFDALRCTAFAKGDVICRQDDIGDGWYELVQGTVRLCHYFSDGRRQVAAFVVPGEVFGLDTSIRKNSAEALTDGMAIWRSPHDQRFASCEQNKDDAASATRCALRRTEECLTLFSYQTAVQRLSAFLLDFHRRMGRPSELELPMSRLDIADHLGLTMHTISRAFSQLAARGLITCPSPQKVLLEDPSVFAEAIGIEDESQMGGMSLVA